MEKSNSDLLQKMVENWREAIKAKRTVEITAFEVDCVVGSLASMQMMLGNIYMILKREGYVTSSEADLLFNLLKDSQRFSDQLLMANYEKFTGDGKDEE